MLLKLNRYLLLPILLIIIGCLDWDITAEKEDANGIYIQYIRTADSTSLPHLEKVSSNLLSSFTECRVKLIDISEKDNPTPLPELVFSSPIIGIKLSKERLYVAHTGEEGDSLSVFIKNNSSFTKEKTIYLNTPIKDNILEEESGLIHCVSSNFLFSIDPNSGVIKNIPLPEGIIEIAAGEGYLYLLFKNGISVYDIKSNLLVSCGIFPREIEEKGEPHNLQKKGDYLYCLIGWNYLFRTKIKDRTNIDFQPEDIEICFKDPILDFSLDRYEVCLSDFEGFLLDFTGAFSPSIKEEFPTEGVEIVTVENWIYVQDGENLKTYEIREFE
jgi:hypothetical protein